MLDRRTFFERIMAFVAGIKIFGPKITEAEASTAKTVEIRHADIVSTSFGGMVQRRLQYLPKDFFVEWGRQVERDPLDATTFANLFLEMMRDPNNDKERKACAVFANLFKAWSWNETLNLVKDSLDAKTKAIFQRKEAEKFYEQFGAIVVEQIRDYWEQFLASRMKDNGDEGEEALTEE
jgi:hypothetical protein